MESTDLNEPDFDALYRELGMPEGGTLDALKLRYRRRVAQWHPDRGAAAAQGQERLKALNLRYSAALDYHRRHGQLPPARRAVVPPSVAAGAAATGPRVRNEVAPKSSRRMAWLVLILSVGALWLLRSNRETPAPVAPAPVQAVASAEEPDRQLRRGLERHAVLRLLGEPIMRDERAELWSYGPSWVQFECGRVAGWYSSPLLGLQAEGVHPGERVGIGPGEPRRSCAPESPLALD